MWKKVLSVGLMGLAAFGVYHAVKDVRSMIQKRRAEKVAPAPAKKK